MSSHEGPGSLSGALDRTRHSLDGTNARLDRLNRRTSWQWVAVGCLLLGLVAFGLTVKRGIDEDRADEQSAAEDERTRCEDAVEGRADLREGIAGVVALIFGQAEDPAALQPLLDDVGDYLATQYPLPACVERLALDVPAPTPPTAPFSTAPSPVPVPEGATTGTVP